VTTAADVTDRLLQAAWSALGGDASDLDLVEVTGNPDAGLLPSTFAVLPAMVAAVCASTLAASVLDAARRGGSPASVLLDVEHVAAAARSERYARMEGSPVVDPFAVLSRFWRTADGWLRLHANYPWHKERALGVLGCQGQPEAVGEAIASWSGTDLEDALAVAGAVGYAVRSRSQWQAHPQGRAVSALQLLGSVAGAGPGRSTGAGRGAVGLRVLDLTRVIAGPVATRTLAAWGADVLRLDSPDLPEIPAQALDTLPGKRSAQLDISRPVGRARLEQLLADADVLVQGYRPGALDRYGLAPQELDARHPHLSVVTLSAWGPTGPWAARRGFDSLVQCPTGIALAEGADGRPGALPAQALDHATGYLAAAAAMLAVAAIQRGEPPRQVRLSLAQTAQWLTAAGTRERSAPREANPEEHMVTLPGASRPVHVISAPGRAGDLLPRWTSTTDLGSDPPAFHPAGGQR
jgi:crotonobetainyl-CoA:carnitine CoA-transferase CaiB-like acyl-CoA transferase